MATIFKAFAKMLRYMWGTCKVLFFVVSLGFRDPVNRFVEYFYMEKDANGGNELFINCTAGNLINYRYV